MPSHYPDVAAACGTDEGALLQHYIQFGASEGRKPSAWGRAGDTDLKLTDDQIAAIWSPVPIKELANYKSLKRKMTDDEFGAGLRAGPQDRYAAGLQEP